METKNSLDRKRVTFIKVLNNLGARHILAILLSLVLSGAAIAFIGHTLYKSTQDELMLNAEMDVMQSTERFNNYLSVDKNTLIIAGYSVNDMLINDAPEKEILRYLTEQTEGLTGAIDKSFTGHKLTKDTDGKYKATYYINGKATNAADYQRKYKSDFQKCQQEMAELNKTSS